VLDLEGETTGLPATLSPTLVANLLRGELGYQGVAVSDDMEMGAITEEHDIADALVGAIRAGIDLLIVSNYLARDPDLPDRLIRRIGALAMEDEALRARIAESAARIGTLKRERLGSLEAS
jgi:beta-N-acetylhexosaminidase